MRTGSVIIRSKDRAATLPRAIASVRAQSVPLEVVVVDSGSTDGTVELARRLADRVVEIPAASFTYGGSLNTGAAASSGEVHFALSAHCVLPHDRFAERTLGFYDDERVAGTNGAQETPMGEPLTGPYVWDGTGLERATNPFWGFSNHGSSWRASVWREDPFDEVLQACEDKEWGLRVTRRGHVLVFDPLLVVDSGHRRAEGLRPLYRRTLKEVRAMRQFTELPPYGLGQAVSDWWSSFPYPSNKPRALRRLSPPRAVEIFGRYVGQR